MIRGASEIGNNASTGATREPRHSVAGTGGKAARVASSVYTGQSDGLEWFRSAAAPSFSFRSKVSYFGEGLPAQSNGRGHLQYALHSDVLGEIRG